MAMQQAIREIRSEGREALSIDALALDYTSHKIGRSRVVHADCFEWLGRIPENSLHAIVTDPPYGVKEYEFDQIEKRANGNGGIWRIPTFMGSGSTIAAAEAVGLSAVGVERYADYYETSVTTIPKLAALQVANESLQIEFEFS